LYFKYVFNLDAVDSSHSQLRNYHFSHPDTFKEINLIRSLQPLLTPDLRIKMS